VCVNYGALLVLLDCCDNFQCYDRFEDDNLHKNVEPEVEDFSIIQIEGEKVASEEVEGLP
jgi:hypothetical protein